MRGMVVAVFEITTDMALLLVLDILVTLELTGVPGKVKFLDPIGVTTLKSL